VLSFGIPNVWNDEKKADIGNIKKGTLV